MIVESFRIINGLENTSLLMLIRAFKREKNTMQVECDI